VVENRAAERTDQDHRSYSPIPPDESERSFADTPLSLSLPVSCRCTPSPQPTAEQLAHGLWLRDLAEAHDERWIPSQPPGQRSRSAHSTSCARGNVGSCLRRYLRGSGSLAYGPVTSSGCCHRPATPTSWVLASTSILTNWGLTVDVGKHALAERGYMAGHDRDRLEDLNAAYHDPDVRAIITTRGGAGAYRLLDGLDSDAVRRDPKPLLGFSDITYLHLALWQQARMPGIHGGIAGPRAASTVRQLLMTDQPSVLHRHDRTYTAALSTSGQATGFLMGGNLMAVATLVGAGLPDLDGAILLLETERPPGLGLGFIDRQLTQLVRSGALHGLRAIALGRFPGYESFSDRGWTLLDVLADRFAGLDIPVLGGLELGHGTDPLATLLGTQAHLDADAGTLIVQPAAIF
jgi:muramoyltetrapeptide carboxypeptidase